MLRIMLCVSAQRSREGALSPLLHEHINTQGVDSIDISTLTGLRDRALIGVMVYTIHPRERRITSRKVRAAGAPA
jgi:hypothetical protein